MKTFGRRRLALLLVAVAALPHGPAAVANPLGPPADTLRVWLVERDGPAARKLTSVVRYSQRQHRWSALFIVGFRMRGDRRELGQGAKSVLAFGDADNPYPYAYTPAGGTPTCTVDALCSWPRAMPDFWWTRVSLAFPTSPGPTTLSFYVMSVNNEDLEITPSSGWTIREIDAEGAGMRATRGDGAAVHVGHGIPGVTRFTGARLHAPGPSVAVGSLPCNAAGPAHTGGRATLTGGDKPRSAFESRLRRTQCGWVRGSSSGPTTWTFGGTSTGIQPSGLTLAVATLPDRT